MLWKLTSHKKWMIRNISWHCAKWDIWIMNICLFALIWAIISITVLILKSCEKLSINYIFCAVSWKYIVMSAREVFFFTKDMLINVQMLNVTMWRSPRSDMPYSHLLIPGNECKLRIWVEPLGFYSFSFVVNGYREKDILLKS